MNKRSPKEVFLRIVILFVGLCIAHLGVTLFLTAELGSDPFNVLIQGLFRTIDKLGLIPGLTHGYTHIGVSILIIIVLLIVDRSYIKIGTIICMACGGPIIDVFTKLLRTTVNADSPMMMRIFTNCIGCIILAVGMTIVIKSDAGTGPNDLVAIVISDKLKKKFSIMRVIVDVTFIIVGFVLGGTFGIGTIICACLVGPVAGIVMPVNERLINKLINI